MRVAFYCADKAREYALGEAFLEGVQAHGDSGQIVQKGKEVVESDVACMVGVKSAKLFRKCLDRGITVIYLDKGYLRHGSSEPVKSWEYWRVSVNSHHPTEYVARANHDFARAASMNLGFDPWRTGANILLAGSSLKYHNFYRLPDPTEYAKSAIEVIRKYSDRPIVYRPKPSWREAKRIPGALYSGSDESIYEVLEDAHVMVTHGSNACFEAVTLGVPVINLGNCVAGPISSSALKDIEKPYLATELERRQWLANLAHCQYTLQEMRTGLAWKFLRDTL